LGVLLQEISPPKFQVLIYLCSFLLVLSATGFSGNGAALTSLTAANLTGTISAAVLGNSTFLLVPQQLL
jgi:hypothetical protein